MPRPLALPNAMAAIQVPPSPPLVPTHPLWKLEPTTIPIRAGHGADPGAYLDSVRTCLEQCSKACRVVRLKPQSSLTVAITPRRGGHLLLKVKLYTVDRDQNVGACEWQRRRGCALSFHDSFNSFLRRSIKFASERILGPTCARAAPLRKMHARTLCNPRFGAHMPTNSFLRYPAACSP